jgi:hypothetical protein
LFSGQVGTSGSGFIKSSFLGRELAEANSSLARRPSAEKTLAVEVTCLILLKQPPDTRVYTCP